MKCQHSAYLILKIVYTVYGLLFKKQHVKQCAVCRQQCVILLTHLNTFNSDCFQKVFKIWIQFCAKNVKILPQTKDMQYASMLFRIKPKLCLVLFFSSFITLEIKNEFEHTALWDIVFHTVYRFTMLHISANIVDRLVISIKKICILCKVCICRNSMSSMVACYSKHIQLHSCPPD